MRVAFTILYNGLHHLTHNNFSEFMAANFDYWAVVDGLSLNGGSTSWCRSLRLPASSVDGSDEYMESFCKEHPNVLYYKATLPFKSKDDQVNKAIDLLKTKTSSGFLWQVDVDEQWTLEKLIQSEKELPKDSSFAGSFQFNHYLCKSVNGKQLVARGSWGNGEVARLWRWSGEKFISHEPAMLQGQKYTALLSSKFDHYSYSFKEDVLFKSMYYPGYRGVYKKWNTLQSKAFKFPVPVSTLLGFGTGAPIKNSFIYEI